jgi:putative Mn2+ efflux pump MntP
VPQSLGSALQTAVLILSLGLDTFAVAVGLGLSGLSARQRFRFGVAFASAEGVMPVVGFLLGKALAAAFGAVASYLAIAVLFGVGLYAIWEAFHEEEREYDDTGFIRLVLLALSVSLDELAIGFTLGLLHVPILLAVVLIAAQAFVVTLLGTALGRKVGEAFAERAELASGVVLSGLAVILLVEKALGI